MNTPIEAVKGKELNQMVDRFLTDGVDVEASLEGLRTQFQQLLYISHAARQGETRLDLYEVEEIERMAESTRGLIASLLKRGSAIAEGQTRSVEPLLTMLIEHDE